MYMNIFDLVVQPKKKTRSLSQLGHRTENPTKVKALDPLDSESWGPEKHTLRMNPVWQGGSGSQTRQFLGVMILRVCGFFLVGR